MKKLKLTLGGTQMLTKDQMKKISGGYDTVCDAAGGCNNSNEWFCCTGFGSWTDMGYMTCCDALTADCSLVAGKKTITTDPYYCTNVY